MKVKTRPAPFSIIFLLCLFSLMLGSANLINPSNSASAMSFQSEQGLAFTINPTVNITVSGDLVINNLTPGDYKDSNIITVTASSNAVAGYTLSSTVGNSTNTSPSFDNTNLNHTNGTNTFTNLVTNISSLDNFDTSSNTWGYSWCDGTCTPSTASTSWVSGNVGSTQTGYNGLPIYTTSSPIQLINSNSAGTSTISFKIGARATSTQVSGTYANIVNFIAVANPNPLITLSDAYAATGKTKYNGYYKLQDMDSTICSTTEALEDDSKMQVIDVRDDEVYWITKLKDGNCWMLENLRLDPTTVALADLKGNTNASDTTLEYLKGERTGTASDQYPTAAVGYGDSSNYYSVPKVSVSGTCYDAYCVDSPSSGEWTSEAVTAATINGSTSIAQGKVGVYYNYCAASAGSYCYGNGTAYTGSPSTDPNPNSIRDVTEDLCPKGWHMPTGNTSGEYNVLYGAYNSDYTAFQTALNTPFSGTFRSGTARVQGYNGRFWSSTWFDTGRMWNLYVVSSAINSTDNEYRNYGNSIRCSQGS